LTADPGREHSLRLQYKGERFEAVGIKRMLGHLERVINGMAAASEGHLGDLTLLGDAERRQILMEWNETLREYPQDQRLHELFEAQAARTPDAVGLVYEDRQLSYRELDRRANQLAHHLQDLGVGPEARVGLCLERNLEMVIGILGVLK